MGDLAVDLQLSALDQISDMIHRVVGWDRFELMDTIGRLAQLQTRRRIQTEKTAPDGTEWPANARGTSTLYQTGRLHDSIDYQVGLGEVTVGSPLIYAAIHHFGGVIKPKNGKALAFMAGGDQVFAKSVTIPARPYIGISSDNAEEIESVVEDFVRGLLQ
ncbi:MAG: phage virion morphogenesis protein [Rhodobacterales bacterium]|nr:MAG: phage virion morphogenesis protein [Rhodobacterales bacterium]